MSSDQPDLPPEATSEAMIDDDDNYFDDQDTTNNENEDEAKNNENYEGTASSSSNNMSSTNQIVHNLLSNLKDDKNNKILHTTTVAQQLDGKNDDITKKYNNILEHTWKELIPGLTDGVRKLFFSFVDTSRQFHIYDITGKLPYGRAESLKGCVDGKRSGPCAKDSLVGMIGWVGGNYPQRGKFPKEGLVVKERYLVKDVTDEKLSDVEIQAFKVEAAKNAAAFEEAKSKPEKINQYEPTLLYVYASDQQGMIGELIGVFTNIQLAQKMLGLRNSGDDSDQLTYSNDKIIFNVAREWTWKSRGKTKGEWWIMKVKGAEKDIPSGVTIDPQSLS